MHLSARLRFRLAARGASLPLLCVQQGVLSIKLGEGRGTFVVNKQSPNRQLWLASPLSGPFRYDSERRARAVVWRYRRDGHLLLDRLQQELSAACGAPCPSLHAE